MIHQSPQAVIDEIESQVARDFQQRGSRLMPVLQADADSAVGKADALLLAVSHRLRDLGARLGLKVSKEGAYLDHVQVSRDLLDAINSRRSSSSKKE